MVPPKHTSLIGRAGDFTNHKLTEIEKDVMIHYKTALRETQAARTVGDWTGVSDKSQGAMSCEPQPAAPLGLGDAAGSLQAEGEEGGSAICPKAVGSLGGGPGLHQRQPLPSFEGSAPLGG